MAYFFSITCIKSKNFDVTIGNASKKIDLYLTKEKKNFHKKRKFQSKFTFCLEPSLQPVIQRFDGFILNRELCYQLIQIVKLLLQFATINHRLKETSSKYYPSALVNFVSNLCDSKQSGFNRQLFNYLFHIDNIHKLIIDLEKRFRKKICLCISLLLSIPSYFYTYRMTRKNKP